MISPEALAKDYELGTGELIVETFKDKKPLEVPMVLVAGHGPFTWGKSAMDAVHYAAALEEVARMAILTFQVNPARRDPARARHAKALRAQARKPAYYGQAT